MASRSCGALVSWLHSYWVHWQVEIPLKTLRGIGYNIYIKKIKLVWGADDSLSWQ